MVPCVRAEEDGGGIGVACVYYAHCLECGCGIGIDVHWSGGEQQESCNGASSYRSKDENQVPGLRFPIELEVVRNLAGAGDGAHRP